MEVIRRRCLRVSEARGWMTPQTTALPPLMDPQSLASSCGLGGAPPRDATGATMNPMSGSPPRDGELPWSSSVAQGGRDPPAPERSPPRDPAPPRDIGGCEGRPASANASSRSRTAKARRALALLDDGGVVGGRSWLRSGGWTSAHAHDGHGKAWVRPMWRRRRRGLKIDRAASRSLAWLGSHFVAYPNGHAPCWPKTQPSPPARSGRDKRRSVSPTATRSAREGRSRAIQRIIGAVRFAKG